MTPIAAHTNEMGVFELALDSLCCAYRGIELFKACPRAALVVTILRRIAYTMLALFRSVTQRPDERRATPWRTLMTDLFIAPITTTDNELKDPKPLRTR